MEKYNQLTSGKSLPRFRQYLSMRSLETISMWISARDEMPI